MITHIIFIIMGLGLLIVAGDLLVRGAVALASKLNVPTLLISLTIVAFGTSAPELVVTVGSVTSGETGIAMGNIIGSNIANILLVLGLPAIIAPIAMTLPGVRRHATVMLVATALFAGFCYVQQKIDFVAGAVMMAGIVAYVIYIGQRAMAGKAETEAVLDEVEEYQELAGAGWKIPTFIIAGLVGLPIGAQLLVDNGAALAEQLGVRDALIGLTIVAFGTSLPELATVVAAALKRHADVAVGNIVGSNIFNLLFVGGAAGLIGVSPIDATTRGVDLPVMIGTALLLALLIYSKTTISRLLGGLMTAVYIGYIIYIGQASVLT